MKEQIEISIRLDKGEDEKINVFSSFNYIKRDIYKWK